MQRYTFFWICANFFVLLHPICGKLPKLRRNKMKKAYFFDMDGVLVNSMPNHAQAWAETLVRYGITFEPRDCYINEGRTSRDVILMLAEQQGLFFTDEQVETIYQEKTNAYRRLGGGTQMPGMKEVLTYLHEQGAQIWVVTGGGQPDLFDQLEGFYPGIFRKDRMVTALQVPIGKPRPEPYLRALEGSGCAKEDCCVVENAPLGIQAGKAAGIFTIGVNTGPLKDTDLYDGGADIVLKDMVQLLEYIQREVK